MRNLLVGILVIALLFVNSVSVFPFSMQEVKIDDIEGELKSALDTTLEENGGFGASVAVIIPDGQIWIGTSGNSHGSIPITHNMLFDMGSIGKNLFSALILKLTEEGLLSLDDQIHEYLPDYPKIDGNITIRQCLQHTSGLYNWVEHEDAPTRIPYNDIDFERWWTVEEIIDELMEEPYFAPGEGWHYTQMGYILCTLIVEQILQTDVPTAIQNRLLDPLNIHGMLLDLTEPVSSNYTIAHNWVDTSGEETYEDESSRSRNWINSLSRILYYSTAEDLARWFHMLFNGEVLSSESLSEMLDFYVREPTPDYPFHGYGLGTLRWYWEGLELWGHGGSIPGYNSVALYSPDYNTTITVMTNFDNEAIYVDIFLALLTVVINHLSNNTVILVVGAVAVIFTVSSLLIIRRKSKQIRSVSTSD